MHGSNRIPAQDITNKIIKGRGAQINPLNRFDSQSYETVDDGWWQEEEATAFKTEVFIDHCKTIVSKNQSPDIPFTQSINPYKGCEHGCVYCYARPTHEYLDLSLGQDFESKLFYKPDAIELLEKYLNKPRYQCETIALGTNTDPYQPLEKDKGTTRAILETLLKYQHPVTIVTKGSLILRDMDILEEMAALKLVSVVISVTTLDNNLKRIMEPRAAAPSARLRVIQTLSSRGIPTGILFAPIIPFINDQEMESVLKACAENGANNAGYVVLRLPYQLRELFTDWLEKHFPLRKSRVLNSIKELREGNLYDNEFGSRMTGKGVYAQLIKNRFEIARKKHGLDRGQATTLRTDLFKCPDKAEQYSFLF